MRYLRKKEQNLGVVGALTYKEESFKMRPWELNSIESIDTTDSSGSNTYINYVGDDIFRVISRSFDSINGAFLSDKARLKYLTSAENRTHIKVTKLLKYNELFSMYLNILYEKEEMSFMEAKVCENISAAFFEQSAVELFFHEYHQNIVKDGKSRSFMEHVDLIKQILFFSDLKSCAPIIYVKLRSTNTIWENQMDSLEDFAGFLFNKKNFKFVDVETTSKLFRAKYGEFKYENSVIIESLFDSRIVGSTHDTFLRIGNKNSNCSNFNVSNTLNACVEFFIGGYFFASFFFSDEKDTKKTTGAEKSSKKSTAPVISKKKGINRNKLVSKKTSFRYLLGRKVYTHFRSEKAKRLYSKYLTIHMGFAFSHQGFFMESLRLGEFPDARVIFHPGIQSKIDYAGQEKSVLTFINNTEDFFNLSFMLKRDNISLEKEKRRMATSMLKVKLLQPLSKNKAVSKLSLAAEDNFFCEQVSYIDLESVLSDYLNKKGIINPSHYYKNSICGSFIGIGLLIKDLNQYSGCNVPLKSVFLDYSEKGITKEVFLAWLDLLHSKESRINSPEYKQ